MFHLVSYGFIDIHNHILPSSNDGAKTVEDSIELLKGFAEFGVNKFISIPHVLPTYYFDNPKTIKNAYELLKKYQISNIKI